MFELAGSPDIGAVAGLVAVSFFSYIAGIILRKWPDKVQAYAETIDGFVWFITPEAHRAIIDRCAVIFVLMSFAALAAAGFML